MIIIFQTETILDTFVSKFYNNLNLAKYLE